MAEVYANTKLLLVPSTYQEGGCRVIAEAFANGVPAVGSDLGGIPDYIGDGGCVVENYRDIAAWVEVVRDILADQERYADLAERAHRRRALFEIEARIDEFEVLLERLADR